MSAETELNFVGMTTNERLFASGKMDEFDDAVRRGDRSTLIEILIAIDVPIPEITADTILSRPAIYESSLLGRPSQ